MAQWFRTLIVLPEDWGSIPQTHMVVHNCLQFTFPNSNILTHIHIKAKHQCVVCNLRLKIRSVTIVATEFFFKQVVLD